MKSMRSMKKMSCGSVNEEMWRPKGFYSIALVHYVNSHSYKKLEIYIVVCVTLLIDFFFKLNQNF